MFFDLMQGPAPGDPYWPEAPKVGYFESIKRPPKKLKVAFSVLPPLGGEVHPDCRRVVENGVKLVNELGHEIIGERDLIIDPAFFSESFITVWTSGVSHNLKFISEQRGTAVRQEEVEPLTWALHEVGRSKSSADYLMAIQQFQKFSRKVAARFQEFDIWITPTLGLPPVPIGFLDSPLEEPLKGFFKGKDFVPFTAVYNVTGQPAMSLPLLWNQEGLPLGCQFAARYGDETTLFQLAAQLAQASPWAGRRPPGF